jgi:anti-anti-sigma factor
MAVQTMGDLGIYQWARAGRHVAMLSGELDVRGAEELESLVARMSIDGAQEIELDLRDLTFVDSSGLRALLACAEVCARNGTAYYLATGEGAAYRLLAQTGVLGLVPTREPRFR